MNLRKILSDRRDGRQHSETEIYALVQGVMSGEVTDYQLAAWLMAAYQRPLEEDETAYLTMALASSGEKLDLTTLGRPYIDKHSTGGIGDKTTLVILPILASCGCAVVKMSGRGLGITGGTLDKLGSIPGFRLDLSPGELVSQAKSIGLALSGQTAQLAPAEKTFYALRDSTETVTSVPLIVSSILSKKIACGAQKVLIDVKCGSGGLVSTLDEAAVLASWLTKIGRRCGLEVQAHITDMNSPLGYAVGNALELIEAAQTLMGSGSRRFMELCVQLSGAALQATRLATSKAQGVKMAREAIRSGKAMEKAKEWVSAQGGDPTIFDDYDFLLEGAVSRTLAHSGPSGFVSELDAATVGEIVLALGGGRRHKEDSIDHRVGVMFHTEIGERVEHGAPLFTMYAASEDDLKTCADKLAYAFSFSNEPVTSTLIYE